jgi:anti-anti-sigma factor
MAIGAAIALAAILVLVRLRNMVAMQWESEGGGVMRLKVNGPLFFMAAQRLQQLPERDREQMTTLLLDMAGVPFMDASALKALSSLQEGAKRQGIVLKLENLQNQPQMLLQKNGFTLA